MALDGQQRVGSLHRSMLPGVTRQNHTRILPTGETQEFEHLPSANLAGLVHDNQRAGNKFTFEQKVCERCWRRKPGFFHVHNLLALRCENDHMPASVLNLLNQITENKAFSRASTTSKN